MNPFVGPQEAKGIPLDRHVNTAQRWLSEMPWSVAVLSQILPEIQEEGERAPTQMYRALVRAVAPHLWDEGEVPSPLWAVPGTWAHGHMSDVGARLVDAMVWHIGSMYAGGAPRWVMGADARLADFGSPLIESNGTLRPFNAVTAWVSLAASKAPLSRLDFPFAVMPELSDLCPDPPLRDDEFDASAARKSAKGGVSRLWRKGAHRWSFDLPDPITPWPEVQIQGEAATAPQLQMSVEELIADVTDSDVPGYTHTVWVHEAAEGEWGAHAFAAHEKHLAKQQGIDKVWGEDREVIHVLAPSLTEPQVLEAARRAAHEAIALTN